MFATHRAAAMGLAAPVVSSVTPPKADRHDYLLENLNFVLACENAGSAEGAVYWSDSATFASATVVACAVVSWGNTSITATMPDFGAVGSEGYVIIVRPDGVASAGVAASALRIQQLFTMAPGSRPTTIQTGPEGLVRFNDGDETMECGDQEGDAFALYGYAQAYDAFAACSVLYTTAEYNWADVLIAADGNTGFQINALANPSGAQAMLRVRDADATPEIQHRVKNSAGALQDGDWVSVSHAGDHTLEMLWALATGTLTSCGWADGTLLGHSAIPWTGSGFGALTLERVYIGIQFNGDGTLVGSPYNPQLPPPLDTAARLVVVRSTAVYGDG